MNGQSRDKEIKIVQLREFNSLLEKEKADSLMKTAKLEDMVKDFTSANTALVMRVGEDFAKINDLERQLQGNRNQLNQLCWQFDLPGNEGALDQFHDLISRRNNEIQRLEVRYTRLHDDLEAAHDDKKRLHQELLALRKTLTSQQAQIRHLANNR